MNILEVHLLTDNIDETRHFYQEVLGFKILYTDTFKISFSAGLSVLNFYKSYKSNPVYHFAFNIPHNKFEEAARWAGLKFNLVEITPSNYVADFKSWNAKAFYFYDNNNNIVEMIARYDLDNSSHGSFHGPGIISVSEIGMVVENPKSYAAGLLKDYNLWFFQKQMPMDDFIALGNDNGLFIVVPANRAWYPTQTLSSKHWVKVIIQLPGGIAAIEINKGEC